MNTQHLHSEDISPNTERRLDIINRIATYDETTRAITHPDPEAYDPSAHILLQEFHALKLRPSPDTPHITIWSFDIDLTLQMPDDEPGCRGPIPVNRLARLQRQGAVVGTCSDRDPSDQRSAMQALDFEPDFCIPKEMLRHLAELMPDAKLTHVGDDCRRDREIAVKSGWTHRWPSYQPTSCPRPAAGDTSR